MFIVVTVQRSLRACCSCYVVSGRGRQGREKPRPRCFDRPAAVKSPASPRWHLSSRRLLSLSTRVPSSDPQTPHTTNTHLFYQPLAQPTEKKKKREKISSFFFQIHLFVLFFFLLGKSCKLLKDFSVVVIFLHFTHFVPHVYFCLPIDLNRSLSSNYSFRCNSSNNQDICR